MLRHAGPATDVWKGLGGGLWLQHRDILPAQTGLCYQDLKGECLPEVSVEVSDRSPLMYDAGTTRLIMIALAALWLPLGRPRILPSVLMLTGGMTTTSTQVPGKYNRRQTFVFIC